MFHRSMEEKNLCTQEGQGARFIGQTLCALGSLALGGGLMYMLDPARGAWRRGLLRGKLTRAWNQTGTALRKTAEYTRDSTRGLVAETRGLLRSETVHDEKLSARVRSAMGRAVSHPSAIEVRASDGVVTLRGPILADEEDHLLRAVGSVRGVSEIINELEPHQTAGDIPALQGGVTGTGQQYPFMQEYWPPTTRLAASVAGTSVGVYGLMRRDLPGILVLLGGGLLTARGLTNLPFKRLIGVGAGRRAIDVQKTINIDAQVEDVFAYFANYENFPLFMRNVREVRDHGNGVSHWTVAGPAGVSVEWDAIVTRWVEDQMIAWKSVEGSTVENAGMIKFHPNDKGGTRVDIKLSYNPPAGALGHVVAKVFGADPKTEMEQDLMRLKTTLEIGRPPRDAAQPVVGTQTS